MNLDKERVLPIIKAALKEDIGAGDITTQSLIDKLASSRASIVVKEDCVVCGLKIAEWAMAQIDYSVRFRPNCDEGASVGSGMEVAFLEGHTAPILRAERTMLNFVSLLSGIATQTKKIADIVRPYGVKIMDTRKTIPLLRYLEKYAVLVGGGANHRMGLYDQVLIKDNHIKSRLLTASATQRNGLLKKLVEEARKKNRRGTIIEIEVASLAEFDDALAGKPDVIMLDNMSPKEIRACVEIRNLAKHKPLLEASGGINAENAEEYAKTGVDMISCGSLTSSVRAIDISLEIA
ncbi:MAG: carboxylating nicotinate-nucleotide diphosphorylase [Candidatus Omnitrophica bacterium]|nr:carboxylating nicotinate-nucleotide diphosphorylase [Candidatus Omnitrophota bacterium]MCM8790348.1 carboxylating nicotinate-nucleotide diphosphorylase [Candidatus Omnitrophota bacterium]